MGKKKSDEAGTNMKTQSGTSKDGKKEKFFASAMLASMDEKPEKPKKASVSSKPKSKAPPEASSYTDDIDLPPFYDEEEYASGEEQQTDAQKRALQLKAELKLLETSVTDKELKKRQKKDMSAAQAAEQAKREALRDDRDAFTVVIGTRASTVEGGDDADANIKDITLENFSVSARGKELLKNASLKISHGKRYGLIGPNRMGKSTLLKLLAWRKVPVPKNIDVLLVEQEVVGDDKTTLEAVVAANEELTRLREEAAALQNSSTDYVFLL